MATAPQFLCPTTAREKDRDASFRRALASIFRPVLRAYDKHAPFNPPSPMFSLHSNFLGNVVADCVTSLRNFRDNRGMSAAEAVLAGRETESDVQERDFEGWVAREQKRIFLLCLRLLRSSDEADSATQDVFVEAYRTLEKSGAQGDP